MGYLLVVDVEPVFISRRTRPRSASFTEIFEVIRQTDGDKIFSLVSMLSSSSISSSGSRT